MLHSYCATPLCWGVVEPPNKFSKKRMGLTGSQLLDGGCWEIEGNVFRGDCGFYINNKLKSQIFNNESL